MDIEAIVKKHYEEWQTVPEASIQDQMRAALTDLAADYEQKLEVERARQIVETKTKWQPIETAPKGKHVLVAKDNKDGTFSYQLAIFADFAIKLWRKPCWHGPRYPLVWEPEFWMQVPPLEVKQQKKELD